MSAVVTWFSVIRCRYYTNIMEYQYLVAMILNKYQDIFTIAHGYLESRDGHPRFDYEVYQVRIYFYTALDDNVMPG